VTTVCASAPHLSACACASPAAARRWDTPASGEGERGEEEEARGERRREKV
jgi:hypothetical protein